jgi:hypothetical protein
MPVAWRPYRSMAAWMRCLSEVRRSRKAMRVRSNSRRSRSSPGGIQLSGSVPLCSRMARPLASSASVLLVLPIRFLASVGLARCGWWPAFSISSTIQYQWPVASRAISLPAGRVWRKSTYCWRWCSTRTAGEVLPLPSMVTKTENCLCASHPIFAGMRLSYGASRAFIGSPLRGNCTET